MAVKETTILSKNIVSLDTERHDGIDNVIVVLLQCLDSLFAADVGLGHDELDILVLDALGVDLLVVILLLFLLLGVAVLGVAVAGVVVALVAALGGSLGSDLLSSSLLGGGVDVLDLGLTKDTAQDISALASSPVASPLSKTHM